MTNWILWVIIFLAGVFMSGTVRRFLPGKAA